jgi:hypothetical protein
MAIASQSRELSYQLLAYLTQSAAEDSPPFGRLAMASQPQTTSLDACTALLSTDRAEQAIARFDEQFRRGPA